MNFIFVLLLATVCLATDLNVQLEPIIAAKTLYPEPVFNAVRDQFASQVRSHLTNNPLFQREYEDLYSRAFQTGSPAVRTQLLAKFRQQAGTAIKRFRPQFLKSIQNTTAERRTEADKDRAALAQVQNKVGPTSTGQTAQLCGWCKPCTGCAMA